MVDVVAGCMTRSWIESVMRSILVEVTIKSVFVAYMTRMIADCMMVSMMTRSIFVEAVSVQYMM